MTFTLYAATVPAFIQFLNAQISLVDKAEAFCLQQQISPEAMLNERIIDDMRPLSYQLKSVVSHSIKAIHALAQGEFSPDGSAAPQSFAEARSMLRDALNQLSALSAEAVNKHTGSAMVFRDGEYRVDFTAETFLMTFTLPNFYFHATTAYNILRMKGLEIGKADFTKRQ